MFWDGLRDEKEGVPLVDGGKGEQAADGFVSRKKTGDGMPSPVARKDFRTDYMSGVMTSSPPI